MAFGTSVASLLETYENCVLLLKAFKRRGTSRGNHDLRMRYTLLRRSVRTDRDEVQMVYASRLSLAGSLFEEGDSRAISSFRRILRRLKDAITSLIRLFSSNPSPSLDYESLMLLSNTSRIDAIKTINKLSDRLSRSSSIRPELSSRSSGSSHTKATRKSRTALESPSWDRDRNTSEREYYAWLGRGPMPTRSPKIEPIKLKLYPAPTRSRSAISDSQNSARLSHVRIRGDRTSMATTSTDSTKLGEIPEWKWRRNYDGGDAYAPEPVYPLKPFRTQVKKQRKKFLGIF